MRAQMAFGCGYSKRILAGRPSPTPRRWIKRSALAGLMAIAHSRLVGGAFLEEVMELAPGSKESPFSRIACFNYNAVNQQYEYFSIDTRAPQTMNERSHETDVASKAQNQVELVLYGDSFVAPRWGEVTNAAFRYRLTIGEIRDDRHVVRLYLTPQSRESAKEFLAFEYVYTRRR